MTRKPTHCRRTILAMGLVCASLMAEPRKNDEEPYTLGIVPFLPPERMELTFGHMAARFSEALGREVVFRTSTTFERYAENVMAEEYDIAYATPFLFVQLRHGPYEPLVQAPGSLSGEILVLEDSPLESVRDLEGEIVAIGPQGSDMEQLVMYTLLEEGLNPDRDLTLRYVEGSLSCLQQLLARAASVCITGSFARERFTEKMGVRLKVIGETVRVPRGLFMVHPRVPHKDQKTLRKLLLSWRADPRNDLPVSGAQWPNFLPVDTRVYDSVLEIERALRDR
jgi:ABC-type phosphate/phosphonate transport system substrate-binding protein